MTVAQTSVEAFLDFEAEGGVTRLQGEVLRAVVFLVDPSNKDIARYLRREINTITPRTNELAEMGMIYRAGKKTDPATGRKAVFWRVQTELLEADRCHTSLREGLRDALGVLS